MCLNTGSSAHSAWFHAFPGITLATHLNEFPDRVDLAQKMRGFFSLKNFLM